jgi:hypothetical protein
LFIFWQSLLRAPAPGRAKNPDSGEPPPTSGIAPLFQTKPPLISFVNHRKFFDSVEKKPHYFIIPSEARNLSVFS